jgi:hypothetical protein
VKLRAHTVGLLVAASVAATWGTATVTSAATTKAESLASRLLPSPFVVEESVKVDLDLDGDLDMVIVGVDGPVPAPEDFEADGTDGNRVLLFARKDRDGYRRVGLGRGALECRRCGGAFWGVVPAPIDITVAKNVVTVEQSAGSREVTSWIHRYRLESGKVRLIGADRTTIDRLNGATISVSTNYLTGVTITAIEGDPDPADNPPKPGRVKGKPKVIAVESVELG